jgi:hypothetical protein
MAFKAFRCHALALVTHRSNFKKILEMKIDAGVDRIIFPYRIARRPARYDRRSMSVDGTELRRLFCESAVVVFLTRRRDCPLIAKSVKIKSVNTTANLKQALSHTAKSSFTRRHS